MNLKVVLILLVLLAFPGLQRVEAQQVETVHSVERHTVVVPEEHSATKALLLSLIPGGGQIYNRQVWKVPIIYGIFAGMGYFIHYNYDKMSSYRDEYLYRVNNGGASQNVEYAGLPQSSVYSLYNSYNRDFQLMCVITVGVYLLNLVDAYVFGHLYGFQINDDLSLNFGPTVQATPMGIQPAVGLTLSF